MQINSGLEDIRVARERERRQVAPIRSAPDTDAGRIDLRQSLQKARGGEHILVFGGATVSRVLRLMKRSSVADAEPIVDREHDATAAREVLIHRIGVAVVVHVVPAKQHLAGGTTVYEDHPGTRTARP